MIKTLSITAFLALLPISELRGAIPYAITNGIRWYFAWGFCAAVNALAAPLCWLFLSTFHKLFLRSNRYKLFFTNFVERSRLKLKTGVDKWGAFGIALFVAVPLPVTGAWTGTLGAWVLGIRKPATMLAVIAGVAAAGAIVTAVVVLGIQTFSFFVK
ncbi:MAG: small multi-drug export protein [Spirochaetaceae bacterium]|jgi:uncharacterized membrane protein|nr:small multi-drug export protein [Spirochaetaceae bacterium]